MDIIRSAEEMRLGGNDESGPQPRSCSLCGYLSSQEVCKACVLLEGLNSGTPRLGVSRVRGTKAPRAHITVG